VCRKDKGKEVKGVSQQSVSIPASIEIEKKKNLSYLQQSAAEESTKEIK